MGDPLLYWRKVLRAYMEGGPIPAYPVEDPEEFIIAGERTHTLEFFDQVESGSNSRLREGLRRASRERRAHNVFKNRKFMDEINSIDGAARKESLPYAWIKGGEFLRRGVYPKGVRRLSDLDLLLRKADLPVWDKIFRDLGFRSHRNPDWILSPDFSPYVSSTFYTREEPRHDLLIDVHWHLIDYPARRASGRWDFGMEPVFDAMENGRLSNEHRVLYLLDHAFTHQFSFWKFVTDLHHVLQGASIDFDFLGREAERTGLRDAACCGAEFLRLFFGGDPPDSLAKIVRRFADRGGSLESNFVERAVRGELNEGSYLKYCLKCLGADTGMLNFIRYLVFPPPAAVPKIESTSNIGATVKLYLNRLIRVLRKGPAILSG